MIRTRKEVTMEKIKPIRTVGRPAVEGRKRQYVIADDVHQWIMTHGGSRYLNETIRAIMAVTPEQ